MELPDRLLSDEAVFFFDDNKIIKQMLYSEFEAVLDRVVGIPEFAAQHYKAAYVTIEAVLNVHSIVLFEILFDDNGHVPDSWNMPLRDLSKEGISGPEFGEGPVYIMTRRLCQEPYYKPLLWEPNSKQKKCFKQIVEAVKKNRLGIYAGESKHHRGLTQHDTNFYNSHVNDARADENQQYATNLQQEESLARLQNEHKKNIDDLKQKHREQLLIISDKYRVKYEQDLDQVKDDFDQQLDVKQLEVHYIQENEKLLKQKITQMNKDIDYAQEKFIAKLINKDIELVVSNIGSGTYSLKPDQVNEYLNNSIGFWAKQGNVSEILYSAWDKHYQNPICQMGAATDCICGKKLKRINNPMDFVIGSSDICTKHQCADS